MKHEEIITYLENAIEMETDILKLEQTVTGMKKEISRRRASRKSYEEHCEFEREMALKECQNRNRSRLSSIESEYFSTSSDATLASAFYEEKHAKFNIMQILYCLGVMLAAFMVSIFVASAIWKDRLETDETLQILIFIIGAVFAFIALIGYILIKFLQKKRSAQRISAMEGNAAAIKKKIEKEKEANQRELQKLSEQFDDKYRAIHVPTINAKKQQEAFLQSQVNETELVLEKLYKQRSEFYSVNIVAPDYRFLDCIVVLKQIFENDLADNVREAILIYEERVFRGEMIRGIDKINEQLVAINNNLEQMNVMMRFVCVKLSEISAQTGAILNELGEIADKIDENTAVSEMILGGIALQCAQNEAINNNAKRLSKLAR